MYQHAQQRHRHRLARRVVSRLLAFVALYTSVLPLLVLAEDAPLRAPGTSGSPFGNDPAVPSQRARPVGNKSRSTSRPAAASEVNSGGELKQVTVNASALTVLGSGVDANKVPNSIRELSAADLTRDGVSGTFADSLERQVGSVNLNNYEGNPYQQDLTYRGFTASPVGGTPIGLAVYEGGVRVNEGFGDVVNWDLIPTFAISSLNLTSANPVFGFNALGGAVALEMKDGFSKPGVSADLSGGSFGRHTEQAQTAWHNDTWAFYLGGNASDEAGWRIDSPSHVRQWYADAGYLNDSTEIHLSYTGADNALVGTGPAPANLLALNYGNSIDFPGLETNDLNMVTLKASQQLAPAWQFDGLAYYRDISQLIFNGAPSSSLPCVAPLNPDTFCSPNPATGAQEELVQAGGQAVPLSVGGSYPGDIDYASTHTNTWGATAQLTSTARLAGHTNHFILGGNLTTNLTGYWTGVHMGMLDDTRTVIDSIPVNSVGGTDATIGLHAQNTYSSLYATDTFDWTERLSLTTSAGLNHARIHLTGVTGRSLDGDDHYQRLNPSTGFAYHLSGAATAFFNYAEDNRVPTPQELECASRTAPCIVATDFLADPPLRQVVSKTFETGVRGALFAGASANVRWSVSLYRAADYDDIYEEPSDVILQGYYANAGDSRRQGLDVSTLFSDDHWRLGVDYSLLYATYESHVALSSPFNPEAGPSGTVNIRPGDALPGQPRNRIKFNADYKITVRWSVGATWTYTSSQYLNGDEANLTAPVGGYTLLGLHSGYDLSDHVELYLTSDNVLDRKYYTFGTWTTENGLPMPRGTTALADTPSYGPGAPVGVWVGVKAFL